MLRWVQEVQGIMELYFRDEKIPRVTIYCPLKEKKPTYWNKHPRGYKKVHIGVCTKTGKEFCGGSNPIPVIEWAENRALMGIMKQEICYD